MIAIGLPHYASVLPEWLHGWHRLQKPDDTAIIETGSRRLVHHGRNEIVKTMLETEATHLFFLDDDTVCPPDGLLRLLADSEQHDLPIVTGLVVQRLRDYLPCVYRRAPNGLYAHLTSFVPGLQQVDACGAACLLIRRDVLEAIATSGQPWFDWASGPVQRGEDIVFCETATALGFPVVLDFDVQCTHLGVLEATYDLFLRESAVVGLRFANEDVARLSADVRPWPMPVKEP